MKARGGLRKKRDAYFYTPAFKSYIIFRWYGTSKVSWRIEKFKNIFKFTRQFLMVQRVVTLKIRQHHGVCLTVFNICCSQTALCIAVVFSNILSAYLAHHIN